MARMTPVANEDRFPPLPGSAAAVNAQIGRTGSRIAAAERWCDSRPVLCGPEGQASPAVVAAALRLRGDHPDWSSVDLERALVSWLVAEARAAA